MSNMIIANKNKIAVFHWGLMSIHTYYLIKQLIVHKIEVDLFIYTPSFVSKDSYEYKLTEELRATIEVIEFNTSYTERTIIKCNRLFNLMPKQKASICINPILPYRTKRKFSTSKYSKIITITQASLFWFYKIDSKSLNKVIHYSLEIEKTSDPNIVKGSCQYALIEQETALLKRISALVIQDEDRASELLNYNIPKQLQLLFFPVSVPKDIVTKKGSYLHNKLKIDPNKKIILYYGAIYQERKIDELIEAAEAINNEELIFVLHGHGNFSHLINHQNKIIASNELVHYDQLNDLCSSAFIGIAFYDQSWPNTRLTAFSSEKIARYLQCGVPFIALKNDNYLKLKKQYNCCELIEDFNEIESAIETIKRNYSDYRNNAFNAFNHYYKIENTVKPLIEYLSV